jgi:hypothetical protein
MLPTSASANRLVACESRNCSWSSGRSPALVVGSGSPDVDLACLESHASHGASGYRSKSQSSRNYDGPDAVRVSELAAGLRGSGSGTNTTRDGTMNGDLARQERTQFVRRQRRFSAGAPHWAEPLVGNSEHRVRGSPGARRSPPDLRVDAPATAGSCPSTGPRRMKPSSSTRPIALQPAVDVVSAVASGRFQ